MARRSKRRCPHRAGAAESAAAHWPVEAGQVGAKAGKAGRCWSCHRSCSRRAASLGLPLAAAAADGMEKELHAAGITCMHRHRHRHRGIGIGIGAWA
jgi:hypothetical protein